LDSGSVRIPADRKRSPRHLKAGPGTADKTKVPQTLLLADDSVTIQRVIELTFADEAIKVVAVSDGDQAIQRIESDPPDIVLVDIGMPGRSGYEVAQHIKQSPRLKHIPVLLLAGAFEPVDQAKAVAAGCDGVLAKPFEPQLVIARVKELLGQNGQRGAPGMPPAAPAPVLVPASTTPFGDSWASPPADAAGDKFPAQVVHLDNYFEQLDAAFQTLGDSAPNTPATNAAAPPDIIDWFAAPPSAADAASDLPLSSHAPEVQQAEPERPAPEPPRLVLPVADRAVALPQEPPLAAATLPRERPSSPATRPPTAALPPLGDAFAAILAAEQHGPPPAFAPEWPASPPSSNGDRSLSEDAIEDIVRRVLDRLSDQVVHAAVADAISSIAERLVGEEIERIKASVK
jgi:CheY-like chemotaxis protein